MFCNNEANTALIILTVATTTNAMGLTVVEERASAQTRATRAALGPASAAGNNAADTERLVTGLAALPDNDELEQLCVELATMVEGADLLTAGRLRKQLHSYDAVRVVLLVLDECAPVPARPHSGVMQQGCRALHVMMDEHAPSRAAAIEFGALPLLARLVVTATTAEARRWGLASLAVLVRSATDAVRAAATDAGAAVAAVVAMAAIGR